MKIGVHIGNEDQIYALNEKITITLNISILLMDINVKFFDQLEARLNPFDTITAIWQARNQSHFSIFKKIITADLALYLSHFHLS